MNMKDKMAPNATQDMTYNRFVLTDESYLSTDNILKSGNNRCFNGTKMKTTPVFNPKNAAMAITTYLENEYDCESRIIAGTSLIIILRFNDRMCLLQFHERFYEGTMTSGLHSHLLAVFSECNKTLPKIEFNFQFDEQLMLHYNRVHLAFQGRLSSI